MKQEMLIKAMLEAKRFLEKAKEELEEIHREMPHELIVGTKRSAAVRRASMDLTRALADLRRP